MKMKKLTKNKKILIGVLLLIGLMLIVIGLKFIKNTKSEEKSIEDCKGNKDCIYKIFEEVLFWQNDYISKWDMSEDENGIFDVVIVSEKGRYEEDKKMVEEIIKEDIQPYVPFEVRVSDLSTPFNSFLVIRNSPRLTLGKIKFEDDIINNNERNKMEKLLEENDECHGFIFNDDFEGGLITGTIGFISATQSVVAMKECLHKQLNSFFIGYNFCENNKSFEYSEKLIGILYREKIKPKMSKQEFKKVFYEIYK